MRWRRRRTFSLRRCCSGWEDGGWARVKVDVAALKKNNTETEAENSKLQAENSQLTADVTRLQAENSQLKADFTRLHAVVVVVKQGPTTASIG